MRLSKGKNNFQDNVYSYWEWSAPVLQTHDEIIAKLAELNLEGRTVKNVRCVGMAYNWNDDNIGEAVYRALGDMSKEDRKRLPNPEAFLPEGVYIPCWAEIDEPFIIEFEDGDALAIDYSEGSSVRMEMNTLPVNILWGTNNPTVHANKLFSDIIGKRITAVEIVTSTVMPEFTGSYGLDLEEQAAYIVGLHIKYNDGSLRYPQKSLFFTSWMDYGEVSIRNHGGEALQIHAPYVKEIVKGFVDDEVLNSQNEFDLSELDK